MRINEYTEETMDLYEKILNREEKISLVGLGYVGMPREIPPLM